MYNAFVILKNKLHILIPLTSKLDCVIEIELKLIYVLLGLVHPTVRIFSSF